MTVGREKWYFSLSGATFSSLMGDGSTLTKSNTTTYTLVTREGRTGVFSTTLAGSNEDTPAIARITSFSFPNGEVRTYSYSAYSVTLIVGVYPHYTTRVVSGYRAESVTNNFGYQIKWLYRSTGTGGIYDLFVTQVLAINNAVDYCAPTATACSGMTVSWPSLSFNCSGGSCAGQAFGSFIQTMLITPNYTPAATSVTDSLGRTTSYPALPGSSVTYLRPSGLTTTILSDGSGRVTSISNGIGTWTYSYVDSGSQRTTTVTDPLSHTTTYVSDPTNLLLLSVRDALGHTTSYSYDASSRLRSVTRPKGDSVTWTYDARGNVTSTVRRGTDLSSTLTTSAIFDTTCTYPAKCNQPNSTKDARGYTTSYTYNTTTGHPLSIISPQGANGLTPETDFAYVGQNARYKNSAGGTVTGSTVSMLSRVANCTNAQTCSGSASEIRKTVISYSVNLQPTEITQGAGDGTLLAHTLLSYDALGNLYTQTDPMGNVTRYRFDAARQLVGLVGPDPDGGGSLANRALRLSYQCDASVKSGCDGLVTLAEQGTVAGQADGAWGGFSSLAQLATTYDVLDRRNFAKLQAGGTWVSLTQFSYDNANRLTCRAIRMNPAAMGSLPSSACSLGTTGSAGPDRITAYYYDSADRLLKSTSGYGTSVAADDVVYSYGGDDELTTQADGKGNLTTIQRDPFLRVLKVFFPTPANGSMSSTTDYEQYTYDNNSNITQDRRRDGTLITYGFDALNQLTAGFNGAQFGYDNLGRMTAANISGQSLSFGYNALSQQIREISALGTVTRQFDLNGIRTGLTYPDSYSVTYNHDAVGELTSITDSSGATLISMGYDNLGRPVSVTRNQGASESLGYGSDLRLASLSYGFADTSKNVTFAYSWNLAGQPTSATVNNALYRNTSARVAAGYASDGLNRYTAVGANSLGYTDNRGNITNTGLQGFTYDGLNRMTSTAGTTLSYDALDRLTQVTGSASTKFLYDGAQIIAEYNGASALQRRYVPGPGLDNPLVWFEGAGTAVGTARWFLANAFGSIAAVGSSGASNSTLGITSYDEYGVSPANPGWRFQYKGMAMIPEVGMYYARARFYSQYLGRFMQTDPSGYSDGMNLYAFARNSPINLSDPTGMTSCDGHEGTPDNPQDGDLAAVVVVATGSGCPRQPAYNMPYDPIPYIIWQVQNLFGLHFNSGGGGTTPQGQNGCPGAVTQWVYDNVSLNAEAQAAWGAGGVVEGDINLKEASGAAGISAASFGADANAGVNFSLYGQGLTNGFYGETQACLHVLVGVCLSVSHQNGHSNWDLSIGTGAGASFSNALKYHKELLPAAPYPGTKPGDCTKKN